MRYEPILITGCSSGIGKATALRLATAGRLVYATARRPETLAELEERGCRALALDVTDEDSMVQAVSTIEAEHGAIGALVNNAGYSLQGAFETVSIEDARRQFETNIFGLARLTQLVLPQMRARGEGRIVNVSSMGGKITLPGAAWYHATKHALEGLSDVMRYELRPFGIDVVIIEPGIIRSSFGDAANATITDEEKAGPYSQFNDRVRRLVDNAYSGPLSRAAASPDAVAKTIEKAVTARRPRTRYVITAGARGIILMKRLLPDRGFDAALRPFYGSARGSETD